jgi:hypothetical protein
MIVIGREVFCCKVSTEARPDDPEASDDVRRLRWLRGTEEHLRMVDPTHHTAEHVEDLRARLRRGEYWLVALADEARIVSYTWLHTRSEIDFPYLPGCTFQVAPDVGYGYDAWTPPELRGGGLRRQGFLEELAILKGLGMAWEASFFVKHQLEGAKRSLGKVGIEIVPLWRVHLVSRTESSFERLVPGDESATPVQPSNA